MQEKLKDDIYHESRSRFPLKLLFPILGCAIFIFTASLASSAPSKGATEIALVLIGKIAMILAPVLVGWGIFRAISPVAVLRFDSGSIWLRCRRYDLGWLDRWQLRQFEFEEIARIEIGFRSDFPYTSYSDTYTYIIFLVEVNTQIGKTICYYYGPLQRVDGWRGLIERIERHSELANKVAIGKLKATGSELP
ncbi:MAG: hypothetical protein C5B54_10725, partial [Acidobacteria bacterium]